MSHLLQLIRTALLVSVALPPPAGLAQESGSPKRVLALHWYDRGYTDDLKFDQELHAALDSALGRVEYYSEYLDTNQFSGVNLSPIMLDYLRRKYAGVTLDAIVAISNPPLDFLLKYRNELFPHTPIVFTIGAVAGAPKIPEAGATGIVTANTFRETVALALKLHPKTKQLFVISGTLNHDKSRESIARAELQGLTDKLAVTYLTDLSVEDLQEKLRDPPKDSIALYVWQQALNREGNILESGDIVSRIAREARLPIYGMAPSYIGLGATGGYVWTIEADVRRLAEFVRQVTTGERPEAVPIENAPVTPMFDWRQLQRWGIHEDQLPPGSVIRFQEATPWQQYKWRIIGIIAVVISQAFLIGALLIARRRAQVRAAALVETQRVLQESEERFRRVFEEGPLGMALIGSDHRFLKVNEALCRMVQYSRAELTRRSFADLAHPDDLQAGVQVAERLFRREIPSYRMQQRYVKKDGEVIWINVTACLILAGEGKHLYGLAMIEDISELKRSAEEALARQKLECVGTLASGIAHDFNNLLGGIMATSELLLSDPDSGVREGLETIKTVAARGAEIVRQLMSYAGQESPAFEEVDLAELLREMLQLLSVSIAKSAAMKIEIPATAPLIWGNPAQLRQVVMNLILNASEAMKDRTGSISVTLAAIRPPDLPAEERQSELSNNGWLGLEVRDSGCGMTDEVQAKIFDPFFSTKRSGRGLGLAAVRGIINTHGGAITVSSRLGEGSSFRILLPCIGETRARAAENVQSSFPRLQEALGTVLIIEDEESLRTSTVKLLRANGVRVLDASDGPSGVQVFRENASTIQTILLDFSLPGIPANEILAEIRQVSPNVPVIITTAYGRDRVWAEVSTDNSVFYLQKPYPFGRLITTVLSVCQATGEQVSIA